MDIKDLGLYMKKNPVLKVRVTFYSGKWYVEYQRKPQWFLDKWWWFDDGVFNDFTDARARAQKLWSQGYYETPERRSFDFDVAATPENENK
jgi:hypothetical protein